MKLNAYVVITRKEIRQFHVWLDTFAPGWLYGSKLAEPCIERTEVVRISNDDYADKCVAGNRGHLIARMHVILPSKESAMLFKLAWLDADVEKPDPKVVDIIP